MAAARRSRWGGAVHRGMKMRMACSGGRVGETEDTAEEDNPDDAPANNFEWRDVAGCSVLLPESGGAKLLIHFTGRALASAAPRLLYRSFLEGVAEETSAIIVATPYNTSFDHDLAAAKSFEFFEKATAELQSQGMRLSALPVFGVGHSVGGVVQLLLSLTQRRSGIVLLAFSQQPAVAFPLPPPPPKQAVPLLDFLRGGISEALERGRVQGGLQFAGTAARTLADVLGPGASIGSPQNSLVNFLKAAGSMEPAVQGDVSQLLAQIAPLLSELADGKRSSSPSRDGLRERIGRAADAGALPPQTLLVDFGNDFLDDTAWLLSALGCKERDEEDEDELDLGWDPLDAIEAELEREMAEAENELDQFGRQVSHEEEILMHHETETRTHMQDNSETATFDSFLLPPPQDPKVEFVRLAGGHTAPLDLPWERFVSEGEMDNRSTGKSQEQNSRMSQLASCVGRFLRGERGQRSPKGLSYSSTFALKAHVFRLLLGTNRGFSVTAPQRRADILSCIEQLEALTPVVIAQGSETDERPRVPEALFGNWHLIEETSPDVLSLASLPLVECGEIRQDIPKTVNGHKAGEELEEFNSVELSAQGAAILSVLPLPSLPVTVKATVRALATPTCGRRLAIRFVGSALELIDDRASGTWPKLELPSPPQVPPQLRGDEQRVNLLTTFVDEEVRVARAPLGDVYVLLRVA
ncbi:unnamed protein product [Polarella glacialis]|uniref:Plastid lipid-associated protein/fibrillin conserved domain-containing protein n=1 Tax=Polarella glacialis TaxID=89957 RepID=A0A813HYF1_POLGL|nr:unnamed protein product [Polarella glacialis]